MGRLELLILAVVVVLVAAGTISLLLLNHRANLRRMRPVGEARKAA